jgi:hypothetical protein
VYVVLYPDEPELSILQDYLVVSCLPCPWTNLPQKVLIEGKMAAPGIRLLESPEDCPDAQPET